METAREDGVDAVGRQCSRKPTEIVWLTDDLKESLDRHSLSQIVTANDEADEVEMGRSAKIAITQHTTH